MVGLWDIASLGLIFLIIALIALRWDNFPFFVDIYYHLSIMEMFDQAGGIVSNDFLQFAPIGRDHLYPPFLHILMLGAYKIGLSADIIGTFVSAGMFPLTMMAIWLLVRKVFGKLEAFLALVLMLCSWQFFYTTAVVSASALATVLALFAYYLIYMGKLRASIVVMSLCLYSHMSYPHLISLSLVIWALMDPERRKFIGKTLAASYLLFSPWIVHMVMNMDSVSSMSMLGGGISFNLILVLSAIAGAALAAHMYLKGERKYILPLAMMVSMVPVFFFYRSRFFVHSAVPMAILGSLAICYLLKIPLSSANIKRRYLGFTAVFFVAIIFLSMGVMYSATGNNLVQGRDNNQNILPNMQQDQGIIPPAGMDKNSIPPAMQQYYDMYGAMPPMDPPAMQQPSGRYESPLQRPGAENNGQEIRNPNNNVKVPPSPDGGNLAKSPTTLYMLLTGDTLNYPSYTTPQMSDLIEDIMENTEPNDIIVVEGGVNGCLITAYTGRATTSGMFHEVSSDDQTELRRIMINESDPVRGTGYSVIDSDLYSHVPVAFPYQIAFILVAVGIVFVIYDLRGDKEK